MPEAEHEVFREPHFTVLQLATLWNVSPDTIRRLFAHEPGVWVYEKPGKTGKRSYRSLRIPASVARRVHQRLSVQGQLPERTRQAYTPTARAERIHRVNALCREDKSAC